MSDGDPAAQIRDAVQHLLDTIGDGWTLTQHVIAMGLERVHDGEIEAIPWVWHPSGQPEWMTRALLADALVLRETAVNDD